MNFGGGEAEKGGEKLKKGGVKAAKAVENRQRQRRVSK